MATSLTGLTPSTTYDALIKVGDNGPIDGTLKALSDGLGNDLPIQVSTAGVNFTGTTTVGGVAVANTTQVAAKQDLLVSGTNIKTINSTSLLGSGDITIAANPSGVAGAIQFSNGSAFASDASNLFWDDTNNRLGVGTNSPTGKTQITESFTTTGNNYSAITFDGTLTSRATASDTIFGFRNTQSIVATALSQTIIANDLTPNYTFFDGNTNSIALRIGGLKNTQNNITAILMQQTASAGNNGLAIQPANSRWQIGYVAGQGSDMGTNARVVYAPTGIRIGTSSAPATNLFEIVGTGSTSATTSLLVQNSAGNNTLKVADNGEVSLGLYATPTSGFALNVGGAMSVKGANNSSDAFGVYVGGTLSTYINAGGDIRTSGKIGLIANPLTALEASAKLQIDSTTQGVLFPRMTTTQKNAISAIAGLVVYDSTTNKLCCYNGSTWNDLF